MLREPIKGYEGIYDITSNGDVIRLERIINMPKGSVGMRKEHILKPHIGTNGYLYVVLSKNAIHKTKYLHRLVAETFIHNPYNLPQVNHKDENKFNNTLENLEWCDSKYNNNYGTAKKRAIENRSNKIDRYSLDGQYIDTWDSENQYLKTHNINGNNLIRLVCKHYKGCKTAYGYRWKFHNDSMPLNENLKKGKHVYQYLKTGELIAEYDNCAQASKAIGISDTCIAKCASGKLNTAKGYKWSYKKKENYYENH